LIVTHSRPFIDEDDLRAVADVLRSGMITQGEKVEQFERAVAQYVGVKYAVACSTGTAALHLALIALEVKAGDEVVLPSYVCSSPYFATLHAGARPRIADIDLDDFNLCAETAKKQLSKSTRALIVPHMFGTPAELDGLLELGFPVIEDCAQALGAEYKGKKVGGIGDVGVLSFYATKVITTGEGGMILTNNAECCQRVLDVRDYDKKSLTKIRYNYKMTDLQAALGISQFKKLQMFTKKRREIALFYADKFSRYDVKLPRSYVRRDSIFFRYVLLVNRLKKVQSAARESGVICERPVFEPLHKSLFEVGFRNTDQVYDHALSVPLYPSLSQEEMEYVAERLGSSISDNG
jgi:dTDP-4-amino-4,6-dideoxygalactose transaminase